MRGEIIMGGSGSGRWGTEKPNHKLTVEGCRLTLDVDLLVRAGVIGPNLTHRGAWEWRDDPGDDEAGASVGFDVRTDNDSGVLQLLYTIATRRDGENVKPPETMDFPIRLVTSGLPSKGRRWWFRCPGQRVGGPDHGPRRVAKLYLPYGARVFACRRCYDLTYQSCRESHQHQAMWNSLGASVGMTGATVRQFWNRDRADEQKQWKRDRQRAVFFGQSGSRV